MTIQFISEKEFRWMSNFYSSPITHQGKVWSTVEHLYQACKAVNPHDQEKIRSAKTPKEAKRIGRSINCRPNWVNVRLDVMKKILRLKFTQNLDLKEKLLQTQDSIEEDAHWDDFWGTGKDGSGENWMGKLLMNLREDLRSMRFYAGIGSRQSPVGILKLMVQIAMALKPHYILRSGGAKGADLAFEKGADSKCEIYLPWKDPFKPHGISKISFKAFEIAKEYHPRWELCNDSAKRLHARNSMILLGEDLKTPVDFVVCWTKGGRRIGGTAQGLRIAEAYKIPIYNLGDSDTASRIVENMGDPKKWVLKKINFYEP